MPVNSVEDAQAWREQNLSIAKRVPLPKPLPNTPIKKETEGYPLPEDRDEARTRREIAEANLAELDEAERRRELISVSAVKAAISTDFAVTRDALMQLPARAAPLLAAETDPAACERMLHAEIHQALTTLAGTTERLLP